MNEALKRIHMQVMWNRLIAVVEEQAQALLHTAFGAITREAGDLSAGVYDTGGRMLAQVVTGTPGHVNTMAAAVRHFLDRVPITTMRPGDVLITNDPERNGAPVRLRHGDAGVPRSAARGPLRVHLPHAGRRWCRLLRRGALGLRGRDLYVGGQR